MLKLKGSEFEADILFRANKLEMSGILTMGRYGVQARMIKNEKTGDPEWKIIPSLPDLEGVIAPSGRQIIIEAKVCSQASYPIYQTDKKRPKQIDHMLDRARFGAVCYFIIHFNARDLLTKSDPAETFAILVDGREHFWRLYQSGAIRSLSRSDAALYGKRIPWNLYSTRASKETPDLTCLLPENFNQPELL